MYKDFDSFKEEVLKDNDIKTSYDALELEYKIIQELINLRLNENLTQEELSKKIGIPKSNISRFESGKHSPSIETLMRFAKGLNKKIDFKIIDF